MTSEKVSTFQGGGRGPKVAVLGGGVAGMSAAHELIERGFQVMVFERQTELCGGKARSIPVPVGGDNSICPDEKGPSGFLPGEHGFRFFPRFYRHVTDTMSRIPVGDKGVHVVDNLTDTSRVEMSLYGKKPIEMPSRFPAPRRIGANRPGLDRQCPGRDGARERRDRVLRREALAGPHQLRCPPPRGVRNHGLVGLRRREQQVRGLSEVPGRGPDPITGAANARLANAHVEGDVGLALILDMLIPGASTDRVLNGPTNEVWLHPGWPTWRNGEWTTNSIERSRRSFASQRRARWGTDRLCRHVRLCGEPVCARRRRLLHSRVAC